MITRAVVGNDQTLLHTFYGEDDETAADATGTPTITIAREDGTVLNAAAATNNPGGTGTYSFPGLATTHFSRVEFLKLTWAGVVSTLTKSDIDYVRVVGGRFFTIAELRAQKGVTNTTTYPNATLKVSRDIAEEFVEQFTRLACVPQYARDVLDGDNSYDIFVTKINARRVIGATLDGSAMTTTDWTLTGSGRLRTDGDIFTVRSHTGQNVAIAYEHGLDAPPPDLKNATLKLARHLTLSLESAIPDRARMMQTEWGMFQLDMANEEKPTGVPEIDSVLCRYRSAVSSWVVA